MESQYRGTRRRPLLALSGLVVCGAMILAGCSSSGGSSTKTNNAGSTQAANGGGSSGSSSCPSSNKTKKLHLAFVSATTSQNPMQEMAAGAKAAADEDGNVELTEQAPSDVNEQKEVQMLESVTRTATDGIAWESVAPDLFVRALQAVKKANIPLVAVDNMTPKGVTPDLLVSNSNYEVGVKLGDAFVAQHPDPNGTVVLGNDIPTLGVLVDRMNGLIHVIKTQLPNMKIIGPFNAQGAGGVTQNTAAWQAQVNAHPNATAFIGVGGPDGISLPLIKAKTHAKWLAGSADIPPQALQGVKDGSLFALSSPEHFMKGYIAIHEIIEHDRKCTPIPSGWWNSGTLLIDKSNVDAVLARQQSESAKLDYFKPVIAQQLANPPMKPFSALN
jgi:ribose transport system substrate-binding protein